jgi:hypothetical protein
MSNARSPINDRECTALAFVINHPVLTLGDIADILDICGNQIWAEMQKHGWPDPAEYIRLGYV